MRYLYHFKPTGDGKLLNKEEQELLIGTVEAENHAAATTKAITLLLDLRERLGRDLIIVEVVEDPPIRLADWVGRKWRYTKLDAQPMPILAIDTQDNWITLEDAEGHPRKMDLDLHINLWRLGKGEIV